MGMLYPYQPRPGSGQAITVNAGRAAFTVPKGSRTICVSNKSTTTILCVRIDPPSQPGVAADPASVKQATANDQWVMPGQSVPFTKDAECDVIDIFCAGQADGQLTDGIGF